MCSKRFDMSRCDTIEWASSYALGDEKIDTEHQKLFELAAEIQNYKENEKNVKIAINELIKYTKFHFANEERFMKSIQYIHLIQHQNIHKQIVKNLNAIIEETSNETILQTSAKIVNFINNGLVQHIMIEDKKVQHFKRSRQGLRYLFAWKSSYKLGNKQIDDDHKNLFNIALKALHFESEADKKGHVRSTIIELNKYMQEHFMREEEFMQSISYPKYEEHKHLHSNIIDQINGLIVRIPIMTLEEFEKMLLTYIDIWLVNHIIHEDQKIMCFESAEK